MSDVKRWELTIDSEGTVDWFVLLRDYAALGAELASWQHSYRLLDERREQLQADRDALKDQVEALRKALQSIAANTCCDRCQEAALVARDALIRRADQPGEQRAKE